MDSGELQTDNGFL